MRIKEKLKSFPNELRHLLWAVFALVLFAIAGQITCDHLGTLKGFPYQCITIVLTFSEIALLYLVVRALFGKGKIIRILAWIIGVLMFLYMLFMSYVLIFGMPSPLEVYSTGWWIGQVDKLEEE